jgi:hypothetical protein
MTLSEKRRAEKEQKSREYEVVDASNPSAIGSSHLRSPANAQDAGIQSSVETAFRNSSYDDSIKRTSTETTIAYEEGQHDGADGASLDSHTNSRPLLLLQEKNGINGRPTGEMIDELDDFDDDTIPSQYDNIPSDENSRPKHQRSRMSKDKKKYRKMGKKEGDECNWKIRENFRGRLGKDGYYSYKLLGECYIQGMMDGEAMRYQNEDGEKGIPSTVFEIR